MDYLKIKILHQTAKEAYKKEEITPDLFLSILLDIEKELIDVSHLKDKKDFLDFVKQYQNG